MLKQWWLLSYVPFFPSRNFLHLLFRSLWFSLADLLCHTRSWAILSITLWELLSSESKKKSLNVWTFFLPKKAVLMKYDGHICIFCEWIWGFSVSVTCYFIREDMHLKSSDEVILCKRFQLKCRYYRHQTPESAEFKAGT